MNSGTKMLVLATCLVAPPTSVHALTRYTDSAACLASLTSVGEGSEQIKTALDHVRDLSRTVVASTPKGTEARRELTRIQQQLERIATRPSFETPKGFAVTEVIEGRDAVLAYLDQTERHATEFTTRAFANVGARTLTRPRLAFRTLRPVIAAALGYLMFKHVSGLTEVSVPAYVGILLGSVTFGGVMTYETMEAGVRWFRYLSHAHRANYAFTHGDERPSSHFADLRGILGAEAIPPLVKSNFDARVRRVDLADLRGPRPDQSAVDLLTDLIAPGTTARPPNEPTGLSRVKIETILFVHPETRATYAVVHVRGIHLAKP